MFRKVSLETEAHVAQGTMKVALSRVHQLLVLILVASSPESKAAFRACKRPLAAVGGSLVFHEEVLVAEFHVALCASKWAFIKVNRPDMLVEVAALLECSVAVRTR